MTKINNDGFVLLVVVHKDRHLPPGRVSSVGMDGFLCNYKIALNQIELDNRAPCSVVRV